SPGNAPSIVVTPASSFGPPGPLRVSQCTLCEWVDPSAYTNVTASGSSTGPPNGTRWYTGCTPTIPRASGVTESSVVVVGARPGADAVTVIGPLAPSAACTIASTLPAYALCVVEM